jgi:hypothetical protein
VHRIVSRARDVYWRYDALNGRATAAAITRDGFLALVAQNVGRARRLRSGRTAPKGWS